MEYYFSLHQIADLAMQVEDAGASFYNNLSRQTDNSKVKAIFIALAKQELGHKESFRVIGDSYKKDESKDKYSIDIYGQMKNAVDKIKVEISTLRNSTRDAINVKHALDLTIQGEELSIKVYTEMQKTFTERFREILEKIINEEKQHLKILLNVKEKTNF